MEKRAILPICSKLLGVRTADIELLQYVLYLKEDEDRESIYLDNEEKISEFVNLFVKLELGNVTKIADNLIEYHITETGKANLVAIHAIHETLGGLAYSRIKKAETLVLLVYLLRNGKKATLTIDDLRELYHVTGSRLSRFSKWKEKLDVIGRDLQTAGAILIVTPQKDSPTSKITNIDFQIVC